MSDAPAAPPTVTAELRDQTRSALRAVGAPTVYVDLLAEVIACETLRNGRKLLQDADVEVQLEAVDRVVESLSYSGSLSDPDRDVAMVRTLYLLCCPIRDPGRGGVSSHLYYEAAERRILRRLLKTWCEAEPRIDFGAALFRVPPNERHEDFEQVCVSTLVASGRMDPTTFIDRDVLLSYEGPNSGTMSGDEKDPHRFAYWVATLKEDALRYLFPLLKTATDDDAGRVALGVLGRLRDLLRFNEVPSRVPDPDHVKAWISAIEERLARRPDDLRLGGALWVAVILEPRVHLDDDVRRRLLDFTLRRLSKFRQAVGATAPSTELPWFGHSEHYSNALHAALLLGGPWKALKSSLLLLRALPGLSVGPELRYWHEPQDAKPGSLRPPTPWRWVAEISVGIATYAARPEECADDADLQGLRSDLARYCLERLGSGPKLTDKDAKPKNDEDMLETSWQWRLAYVEAVRELRVNPGGRGHHVLCWLRENDPRPEVRKLAAIAYDEMTKNVLLAPGVTPLRSILVALLWLRKAHIEHLGLTMDPDGARRTRRKEAQMSRR